MEFCFFFVVFFVSEENWRTEESRQETRVDEETKQKKKYNIIHMHSVPDVPDSG